MTDLMNPIFKSDKDSENISLKSEIQKLQERIKELEKDYKEL